MAVAFPNEVNLVSPGAITESGTGNSWAAPLSDAIDNNPYTSIVASSLLVSGNYSKSLSFTNFDFSWFDNSLYDVTGVNIIMQCAGASHLQFAEAYLIDETGADLGSNIGGISGEWITGTSGFIDLIGGGATAYATSKEIVRSIPYSTFSHSNFGIRLRVKNTGGVTSSPVIYGLWMVLQFARKRTTSSFGFALFSAAGASAGSQTSAFVRLVESVSHVGGYTGSETLANWDDRLGVPIVYGHWEKWDEVYNVQVSKGRAWSSVYQNIRGHSSELPALDYTRATKSLVFSASTNYPLPAGFDSNGELSCGFTYIFIHYK